MKTFYISAIALLLLSTIGHAQVGIGTTVPKAQLEIAASNQAAPSNSDGLIIPKVDAFPAVNPGAAQQSMLVYLTTTSAGKAPGFYYWDNNTTSWISINAKAGWELTGNAGTSSATNFIGTTDNNDVMFRRNNIKAGQLGETNTSWGNAALNTNTTGFSNVAIGASSLFNNTQNEIVGVGSNALYSNTTGQFNTAVGTNAARTNATGICVTSMGYNSLFNSTGSFNTAFGVNALSTNQTGIWNTAFGVDALRSSTIGQYNTAIGDRTMIDNIDGEQNTAVGHSAMANIESGDHNVSVGMNSFYTNQAGNRNTALGTGALYWHATGNDNTALGMEAMNNQTAGNNNIAIGKGANVPSLTGSDQLSIANVIYGTGMASPITARIGIGTSAPQTKFHLQGSTASGMTPNPFALATIESNNPSYLNFLSNTESAILFGEDGDATRGGMVYNSDFMMLRTGGNANRMIIGPTGNVAIGNFTPQFPLHFAATLGDKISLWGNVAANHYGFGIQSQLLQIHSDHDYSDIAFGYGSSAAMTENVRFTGTGEVGIGTSAPASKLHVQSGSSGMTPNPSAAITAERSNPYAYLNVLSSQETGVLFGASGNASDGGIVYNANTQPNSLMLRTGGNLNRVIIGPTGNVALGNFAPSVPLHFPDLLGDKISLYGSGAFHYGFGVQGNLLQIHSDIVGSDIAFGYGSSAAFTENVRIRGNGNVGIGLTVPEHPLQFKAALGDKISLYGGAGNHYGFGVQHNLLQIHSDLVGSDIVFGFGSSTSLTETMRMKGTGQIGIGTSTPTAKLHVVNNSTGITPNPFAQIILDNTGYSFMNLNSNGESGVIFGTSTGGTNGGIVYNSGTYVDGMNFRTGGNINRMSITAAGNTEINGFTKLGATAPSVKMIKLTGTTAATQGTQTPIPHGLTSSKILSVNVLVEYASGSSVPPSYNSSAGYEYDYFINGTSIVVWPKTGNSANILSKAIRILVTYEE